MVEGRYDGFLSIDQGVFMPAMGAMAASFYTVSAWPFAVTMVTHLPWLAVALAGGWALLRQRNSIPVWMQVIGASCCFLLAIVQHIALAMLQWMGATLNVLSASQIIFSFLWFVMLVTFAAGYCWERVLRKRDGGTGFPVAAVPVGKRN